MLNKIAAALMVDSLGSRIADIDPARLPKKFLQLEGSDNTKWSKGSLESDSGKLSLQARGFKSSRSIAIAGSTAFHYQGHNIVSSGDVTMQAYSAVEAVHRKFDLGIGKKRALRFSQGYDIEVTRLDTPIMLSIPDGLNMPAVINAMALSGILSGINTSLYVGKTGYFDQHSQLRSLKYYDKAAELSAKKRAVVPNTANGRALLDLATTKARLEAVYRQKYLKRYFRDHEMVTPSMLTPMVMAEMFVDLLAECDFRRDLRRMLNEDQLMAIPRRFRPTAMYWMHGQNVLKMLDGDKSEYSRHRGFLLKNYSLDIYGPPPTEIEDRVELGEILSPENFVPVPDEIRADPALFFDRDMDAERQWLEDELEKLRCVAY